MLNRKDFLKEEKECADMLGMSVEEYREYVKNVKIPTEQSKEDQRYDNSVLIKLGLSTEDLKKRKDLY